MALIAIEFLVTDIDKEPLQLLR